MAGDLLLTETRILAEMVLRGVSADEINQRVRSENILQKRTVATGVREGRLIMNRLELADRELLSLIVNDNRQIAKQAVLVLAIEHSRLIGDFLRRVIKERWRVFEQQLRPSDWDAFLDECEQFDPSVRNWKPVTRAKLGQVVKRILVQAGFLEGKTNHRIIPAMIMPEIRRYLAENKKFETLDSLTLAL